MSSYTETGWRPTTYRVTSKHGLSGVRVLDLGQLLGAKGCELLRSTLAAQEQQGTCEWRRAAGEAGESTYQVSISEGLPANVSALSIDLRIYGGVSEVTHRWTYRTTEIRTSTDASSVPEMTTAAVQRQVNRTCNRLLMHVVAHQYRERLQQQVTGVGLHARVQMYRRQENQVQCIVSTRRG